MKSIQFDIAVVEHLEITDNEISELLNRVYVDGGFTTSDEAVFLFDPKAVRARGILIGARENRHSRLAGMAIVVPPESPAKRLATKDECEMHLLGVSPEYRGQGLGCKLINAATQKAASIGCSKMILWTQSSMKTAQQLYERAGFNYTGDIERNGRVFKVYEQKL